MLLEEEWEELNELIKKKVIEKVVEEKTEEIELEKKVAEEEQKLDRKIKKDEKTKIEKEKKREKDNKRYGYDIENTKINNIIKNMINYNNRNKKWLSDQKIKSLEEYHEKNGDLHKKERETLCKLQLIKNKRTINRNKRIGVTIQKEWFKREIVEENTRNLYIFGENNIDHKTQNSSKTTQAVIRGLENAAPIRTCYTRNKGYTDEKKNEEEKHGLAIIMKTEKDKEMNMVNRTEEK